MQPVNIAESQMISWYLLLLCIYIYIYIYIYTAAKIAFVSAFKTYIPPYITHATRILVNHLHSLHISLIELYSNLASTALSR